MIKDEIIEKIKEAMHVSILDTFEFTYDEIHLMDAEYLLTVNIAKSINTLNNYFGTPYRIYLEHRTKYFASSCTPIFDENFALRCYDPSSRFSSQTDTERKGKIDIAIYTHDNPVDKPVCPIEVKGFNPSKTEILKDLKRNIEYFGIKSTTGKSNLPFSLFVALHMYRLPFSVAKKLSNEKRIFGRYKSYLKEIKTDEKLKHSIKVHTVSEGRPPYEDPEEQGVGIFEPNQDYQYMGVIVCTEREKN
jgi:hypothetical protein